MGDLAALQKAQARLRQAGVIPAAVAALNKSLGTAGKSLRQTVLAEVPALSRSVSRDIASERDQHAVEHLKEIVRLFGGGKIAEFRFVRDHARLRAEQGFPLEATLHAYRCGHKVLSSWMRRAAASVRSARSERSVAAVADFALEYTNAVSSVMTAEYVAHSRRLAGAEGDRRADMLNALLGGGEAAFGDLGPLLKRAGYLAPRQGFCVAVVQSTDPLEMRSAPRAHRVVEAINAAFAATNIRVLSGVRDLAVVSIFAATRRESGWTAARDDLVQRVHAALLGLGPAVLVGVSSEQGSLALIPKARQEATIAMSCAHVGDRVARFDALSLRRLLIHSSLDYLKTVLPHWAPAFLAANERARGALVDTLRAYADADMNLIHAAQALSVHPNTLYARMRRIETLTGLSSQRFRDLNELLIVADCRAGDVDGIRA